MDDFKNLPLLNSRESLSAISAAKISVAEKLLASSMVTQSRSYIYTMQDTHEELLVLDVTAFLNHRINNLLIQSIGKELAKRISKFDIDLILTAPSSGNIPAIMTAVDLLSAPDIIYAPKGMPITMTQVYQAQSRSYTHGKSVNFTVSRQCLKARSHVAICDDFLDTGKTATDLANIVSQARASVSVLFFVIEKPFGGRTWLQKAGYDDTQIISLIKIDSMRPGRIKLNGFNYWFELLNV